MSGNNPYWLTPREVYGPLDKEFSFTFDPCPYPYKEDAIEKEWGNVNWVNPPFTKKDAINNHGPTAFVRKAILEQEKGKTSVIILPVQLYVNLLIEAGAEIRSAGRVKWVHAQTGERYKSPGNCAIFVLKPKEAGK